MNSTTQSTILGQMATEPALDIHAGTIWSASSRTVYDHLRAAIATIDKLQRLTHEQAQSRLVDCIGHIGNARAEAVRLAQSEWCQQMDVASGEIRHILKANYQFDEHLLIGLDSILNQLADDIWGAR